LKALRTFGPRDSRIVDQPRPQVGPAEALMRVRAVGICRTDLEIFGGHHPEYASGIAHYPIVLGHEWSGEVVEVGAEVTSLGIGDRAVGETGIGCMSCDLCKSGRYHLCPFGTETGVINRDGALRQYHVAPAFSLHKHNLPHEQACLIEPASVGVYAAMKAGVSPGENAAVIGDGAIGLLCVQAAKAAGAAEVALVGHHDDRLQVGQRLGADKTINSHSADPVPTLAELAESCRPGVVIEAAGAADALDIALHIVARGGVVAVVGYSAAEPYRHSLAPIIGGEIELLGVRGSPNCWPQTIRLIEAGAIVIEPLVGPRFSLDDFADALSAAQSGVAGAARIIIEPNS